MQKHKQCGINYQPGAGPQMLLIKAPWPYLCFLQFNKVINRQSVLTVVTKHFIVRLRVNIISPYKQRQMLWTWCMISSRATICVHNDPNIITLTLILTVQNNNKKTTQMYTKAVQKHIAFFGMTFNACVIANIDSQLTIPARLDEFWCQQFWFATITHLKYSAF